MELQLIKSKIIALRGQRVMLDFDLAELYEVETRELNQSVKRNARRFPEDFMFQLTWEEMKNLISQIVISSWGGNRKRPFAFTEQGVAMLSAVLKSDKAIDTNIAIMRAFVAIRRFSLTFDELAAKVMEHDKGMADVNEVLRWLGEENQARYDEIQALHTDDVLPKDWDERARIGFRKEV